MSAEVEERLRADMALFFARNVAGLAAHRRARGWSICWPGLLFPQAWFLYRKMYLWAAAVTAGPLLTAYIPGLAYLDWAASLLGALGLRLYFAGARMTISRIRAGAEDEEQARALIARAGGVSWVGGAMGLIFAFSAFLMTLKGAPPVLRLR